MLRPSNVRTTTSLCCLQNRELLYLRPNAAASQHNCEANIISELARYDVSQQPRSGHALVDRCLRLGCGFHLRVVSSALAGRAGIFLAQMMDAFEVAGKIFDLPAMVRADFLALDAAAWASPLLLAQLVDTGGYRKIFEVSEVTPSLAPLHTSKFFCRFAVRWNIVRINRFAIHLLGERQKHLRQITRGLQTISARTVVPLAIPLQL